VSAARVLALLVASQGTDPVEPPPEAPAPVVEEAPPAEPVEPTPAVDEAVAPEPHTDALVRCKALVVDDHIADAIRCLRADDIPEAERATALEMATVLEKWHPAPPAPPPPPPPAEPRGLLESGAAEAMLHASAAGLGGGFLASATLFSSTRQSKNDTLPWLIGVPAAGAIAGAAGAYVLVENLHPTTGDISLVASTMWIGAFEGVMLQLSVFNESFTVSATPLRFATVLGMGTLGLAAGVGLAPLLDVTQGDVAVANSAALWGGVATGLAMAAYATDGRSITPAQWPLLLGAGALLPYVGAIAAHPLLEIDRWPSFLIDAGGVTGLLLSGTAVAFLAQAGFFNGASPSGAILFVGASSAAGAVGGGAAAWLVTDVLRSQVTAPALPKIGLAPTLILDDDNRAAPALALAGRF
jgi:hypothetical protein